MHNQNQAPPPTGLQVDLARRIANDIICRIHQAGTHLSEVSLARRYLVSRTPVRAALRLLAAERFIEARPNSGYFVPEVPGCTEPPSLRARGMTADEIYLRMIDDRAEGLLPDSFTDRDLQQRYGVTRSVLAKTLVRMSAEAMIEKRKGHGWRFTHALGGCDARHESYRFRATVECGALLEPGFKAVSAELKRLRAAHEELLRNGEISAQAFFALNSDFHETLARFSGNRFFLQSIRQQNHLRRMEQQSAAMRADTRFRESAAEHLAIIQALEDDDREWAAALMRRHLLEVSKLG
ncbi:GntR family transcriptional regulator [Bordetella genomosp. 9]|uniref:FCD domain-containing protein n=1 Tax=Bordetella genomosp. 9 TaxID=1416803 RepID=UPI000A28F156|nr:FCD domain-containing protein [Bordetella genomosp. 9]ARP91297.1 GntR family transcriptional regulator [Bordetella genomosp. 9]